MFSACFQSQVQPKLRPHGFLVIRPFLPLGPARASWSPRPSSPRCAASPTACWWSPPETPRTPSGRLGSSSCSAGERAALLGRGGGGSQRPRSGGCGTLCPGPTLPPPRAPRLQDCKACPARVVPTALVSDLISHLHQFVTLTVCLSRRKNPDFVKFRGSKPCLSSAARKDCSVPLVILTRSEGVGGFRPLVVISDECAWFEKFLKFIWIYLVMGD